MPLFVGEGTSSYVSCWAQSAFSPDAKRASGYENRTIRLWDITNGKKFYVLSRRLLRQKECAETFCDVMPLPIEAGK
jgi:WD40 repeat protein